MQVTKPSEVPTGRHYAVLVYDERTVENPGRGFEKITTVQHHVFEDRFDWEAFILRCYGSNSHGKVEFVAFEVEGLARVDVEIRTTVRLP